MSAADAVEKARKLLAAMSLCDSCLGRLFGLLGYGLSNEERGRSIKSMLLMSAYDSVTGSSDPEVITSLARSGFGPAKELASKMGLEYEEQTCHLCGGLMGRLDELALVCAQAAGGVEYETFQIGCSLPLEYIEREESLWESYGLERSESIKSDVTRELGKRLQRLTGKRYVSRNPDIVFVVYPLEMKARLLIKPLCVYGRYRKLVRGLPQNPWLAEKDERIAYETSVEELITTPLVAMTGGTAAKLHAAGREDIDVRTLGNGRPFIVEVKNPKVRSLKLEEAAERINSYAQGLLEVTGLSIVDKRLVPKLKAFAEIARKTYIARVRFESPVTPEALKRLEEAFRNVVVRQRTPTRVLGRRPDKTRSKVVYEVGSEWVNPDEAVLTITCQGGLYVKELIHGDDGRTRPSVAELLGVPVKVLALDVVWIEDPPFIRAGERR